MCLTLGCTDAMMVCVLGGDGAMDQETLRQLAELMTANE